MTRVAVFIDYQNVYHGVREAFGGSHFTDGQVEPGRLGVKLTDLGRPVDPARQLGYVKVFRGEPSAKHSRSGQAACHRQVSRWNAQAGVKCITRPLKYYRTGTLPNGTPTYEAQEKGIDVLLALHLVMGAMRDEYDVAVLVTADSDLIPAVETVFELGKRCEVAAWQGRSGRRSRLTLASRNLWCHWLDYHVYQLVADPTDYTQP